MGADVERDQPRAGDGVMGGTNEEKTSAERSVFMPGLPMTIELHLWLRKATEGLPEPARQKAQNEFAEHYSQSCQHAQARGATKPDAHRCAIAALGEPKLVAKKLRRENDKKQQMMPRENWHWSDLLVMFAGLYPILDIYEGAYFVALLGCVLFALLAGLTFRVIPMAARSRSYEMVSSYWGAQQALFGSVILLHLDRQHADERLAADLIGLAVVGGLGVCVFHGIAHLYSRRAHE